MGEVKHTPGPWHIYRLDDRVVCGPKSSDGDEVLLASFYASGNSMIHTPSSYEVTNKNTAKANARLMAASPDMLTAHKENARILAFLVNELQGRIDGGKLAALAGCLERSQNSIAKATAQ